MAKQWTELEKLTIKKGAHVSNAIALHPKTGTIATLTFYAPDSMHDAFIHLSADGETFYPFKHKGQSVKVEAGYACDIPLPACKAMRLETLGEPEEDLAFQVLALLEVD
jgi:hypothetical protein